jgi:hypothetical protein
MFIFFIAFSSSPIFFMVMSGRGIIQRLGAPHKTWETKKTNNHAIKQLA